MDKKECSKCGEVKGFSEFYKHKLHLDGLTYRCKKCSNELNLKYYRTINGLITRIYSDQIKSSKSRGHNPPEYSKQEFAEWITACGNFSNIYSKWVDSKYDSMLRPSVDRLNDYIGYSFKNIQLITWGEHIIKTHEDIKNGINNKNSISINQYDKSGVFIKNWYSSKQAARSLNLSQGNISRSCLLESSGLVGGFMFRLSKNGNKNNIKPYVNKKLKIVEIFKDNVFVRRFNSLIEASIFLKVSTSHISICTDNKNRMCVGYVVKSC